VGRKIEFGVGIPTGTEGLMYPVPFASATENVRMAQRAEELGYHSVWGNDHVSTQAYVREEFGQSPNYYSPLLVLASIAAATTQIKLCTALLVLPFRHPVVVAKEVATLDHLSGGRVLLGVGIGAYREEFKAMYGPAAGKRNRGEMLDESLEAITRIFQSEDAQFDGKYYQFSGVNSYPKPVQSPFPIYIGGNSPEGRRRVAQYGQGWLPAVLSPEEIQAGVEEIAKHCEAVDKDASNIDIAPQFTVSIGRTHEEAVKRYENSQVYKHLVSLKNSTLKNQQEGSLTERGLLGSPEEIAEQIQHYVDAGVTSFSALLFCANSLGEFYESMEWFSQEVMSKFK
jgi:probable F420-dependent oxidoreductase